MKKSRILAGIFLMLFTLILVGCGDSNIDEVGANSSNGDTITLSYAFFTSEASYPGQMASYWAKEVNKRTNGKVNVEVYYSNTLLDAANMVDGVKKGVADIGLFTSSYEVGSFPLGQIADLPNGYGNATIASKVNKALIEEFPESRLDGLKVLKVFTTDPLYIHSNRKVETLKDLKGLQMRTPSNFTVLLDKLGAAAVGMSQAEQASALQTGIIEGSLTDRGGLRDSKLSELIDYVINVPLGTSTFLAIMTEEKWNSLPADVQEVMTQLSEEMPEYAGKYVDVRTKEILEEAKADGVEVVSLKDGDLQNWEAVFKGLKQEYIEDAKSKGLPAEELDARIKELTEQYKAE